MKNYILLFLLSIIYFSCQEESNIVTFSGKIENYHTDSITIFHPKVEYRKVIKLNKDGSFSDTLSVNDGLFSYTDGRDFTMLYLKKGNTINMEYDTHDFYETIYFQGDHHDENNFLAESVDNENNFLSDTKLMRLPEKEFHSEVNTYVDAFKNRLNSKDFDSSFKKYEIKEIEYFKDYITKSYSKINYNKIFLAKGKPSPNFENYKNYKGNTSSLSDFKGKYTYIDVWATWCTPCKTEFPYLKELEESFKDKDINFVSISIDDERDYETWKSVIKEYELTGNQLFANGDTSFSSAYRVSSIPRFILLDPKGNIIKATAPRPSDPEIIELLNSLL